MLGLGMSGYVTVWALKSQAKAPLSGNNSLQADVVAEVLEFLYLDIPSILG